MQKLISALVVVVEYFLENGAPNYIFHIFDLFSIYKVCWLLLNQVTNLQKKKFCPLFPIHFY